MEKHKNFRDFIRSIFSPALAMLLLFGCTTVQQQYQNLIQKGNDVSDTKEEQPITSEGAGITEREELGVVVNIKQFLPVKAGPSGETKTLGKLNLGDKITIEREQGKWLYIAQKDEMGTARIEGWVVKNFVKRLPPKEQTEPSLPESEEIANQGFVVDIKDNLSVKSGPSRETKTLGRLYLGDKVTIDKEQGRWIYVTRNDETGPTQLEGWVVKKYVERLSLMEQDAGSLIELAYIRKTDYSTEESNIKKMKIRTTAQGATIGAVTGAVIGGGRAWLTGENVTQGAAIGGALGLAGGLAAGSYIAHQKEKYATEEAYLDACIQEAIEYNKAAKDHNARLKRVIAATEQEITVLHDKIKNADTRKMRAQNDITTMEEISQDTENLIKMLQGQVEAQQTAFKELEDDAALLKAFQREAQTTKMQIQDLKVKRDQLTTLIGELAKQTV